MSRSKSKNPTKPQSWSIRESVLKQFDELLLLRHEQGDPCSASALANELLEMALSSLPTQRTRVSRQHPPKLSQMTPPNPTIPLPPDWTPGPCLSEDQINQILGPPIYKKNEIKTDGERKLDEVGNAKRFELNTPGWGKPPVEKEETLELNEPQKNNPHSSEKEDLELVDKDYYRQ